MADAAKPVDPVAPAAGVDVQTPVATTELDGTTAQAAAPVVDPAAPAAPEQVEQAAKPAENQTSKAEKRKSRSGDLLKKLQFWKKDKKDDAVVQ